ncbi:hypothetical protein [Flavobacterium terrigena]|uniref:Tetratricopeptide repeat-containing protein n=1 Tax=Flavobacterium terrigena TaxID=402734 RepID=A0A1H6V2E6_9FLAO|nr:hypothetical protein [Flavobacterium terrigena]SEI94790.1 hypothetical protein SAMN05660918_2014 [Flavobacterium terrigena]
MKSFFCSLIVFLTISTLCFSQTKYDNFDSLIHNADSLRLSENYKVAYKEYVKALNVLTPKSSTEFFNVAFCALKNNNSKLAKKWIEKGVSEGGAQLDYLKNFEGFSEIQNESFYIEIINKYDALRQQYFSKIKNIDIYLEIEELVQRDQFVRKLNDYIILRSDNDIKIASEGYKKAIESNDSILIAKYKLLLFPQPKKEHEIVFDELTQKIDSLNIERLIEITKVHGWQERAWLILWHQRGNHDEDNYVWNYFRPLINKEIEEGKISRTFWKPFDEFKKMLKNSRVIQAQN